MADQGSDLAGEPIRVLVVDDQELFRRGLTMLLAAEPGIEVVGEAGDGVEGTSLASSVAPDVILLDWNMPVMSGMEFLRALGEEPMPRRPKVVFCTTENGMAHIRAAIEAGADEYVMKPFDRETLHSKLQIVGVA